MTALTGYRPGAMATARSATDGGNTLLAARLQRADSMVFNRFFKIVLRHDSMGGDYDAYCADVQARSDAYDAARAMARRDEPWDVIVACIEARAAAREAAPKRPWWRPW